MPGKNIPILALLLLSLFVFPIFAHGASFFKGEDHIKYFGFYGQRIYSDSLISGFANVSFASPVSANDPLSLVDYHKSFGIYSLYTVQSIFFWEDYFGSNAKVSTLAPDYQEKWAAFAPTIASRVNDGSIVAFYLYDEPYGNMEEGTGGAQPISRQQAYTNLQKAAQAIKATFPNTPIFVVEDRLHLEKDSGVSSSLFPPEIDWVGFDCYRGTFESCAFEGRSVTELYDLVKSGLASNQKIVLVPQVAAYTNTPNASDQAYILDLFNKYLELAKSESKVVAVLGFTAENYGPFSDGKKFWGALEESWGNLDNTALRSELLSKGRGVLIPPKLKLNKKTLAAGEEIGVSWENIPSPKNKDWIILATSTSKDYLPLDWIYVSCSQTPLNASKDGTCNFKIPLATEPGKYELRLFENNDYKRMAVSSSFTVTKPGSTSTSSSSSSSSSSSTSSKSKSKTTTTKSVTTTNATSTTTTAVTSTTPNKTVYNFGTATLKNGSSGEAVKELQRFLNKILNLGLVVDGKLGPKTIAVIKTWQKNNGLVPDGLVGPKTKAMMNAASQ